MEIGTFAMFLMGAGDAYYRDGLFPAGGGNVHDPSRWRDGDPASQKVKNRTTSFQCFLLSALLYDRRAWFTSIGRAIAGRSPVIYWFGRWRSAWGFVWPSLSLRILFKINFPSYWVVLYLLVNLTFFSYTKRFCPCRLRFRWGYYRSDSPFPHLA